MNKVVFLDRDGVINQDSPHYIKSWAEFEFIPGSLEAMRRLTLAGFEIIVITNQSAIGRGLITRAVLEEMHARLRMAVTAAGGDIRDIFFCPHRPDEACTCRKPGPGMIHQAAIRYAIDPAGSVMIGDSARDIQCGQAAGCGATILVRTGKGLGAEQDVSQKGLKPEIIVDDLWCAVDWLLARSVSGASVLSFSNRLPENSPP